MRISKIIIMMLLIAAVVRPGQVQAQVRAPALPISCSSVIMPCRGFTVECSSVINVQGNDNTKVNINQASLLMRSSLPRCVSSISSRPAKRILDGVREIIHKIADTLKLNPTIIEAVATAESGGNQAAISPMGAIGTMQIMPGTAKSLGVNPYNLEENIQGGAMYLKMQIERFGSLPLALAAYNAGPGAVQKYGGIPPYRETQDYVARVMSMLELEGEA